MPFESPGSWSRPRPGSPAPPFTAPDDVGAMQNIAASVGFDVSATGGSARPFAFTLFPTTPLSVKHLRNFAVTGVAPHTWISQVPPGHCEPTVQPRKPAFVPPMQRSASACRPKGGRSA